jgi:hypothetical protein
VTTASVYADIAGHRTPTSCRSATDFPSRVDNPYPRDEGAHDRSDRGEAGTVTTEWYDTPKPHHATAWRPGSVV